MESVTIIQFPVVIALACCAVALAKRGEGKCTVSRDGLGLVNRLKSSLRLYLIFSSLQ